jgi:hypothetical protein
LLAKKPVDINPQIAQRAYELYQERVHGQSPAEQDWLEAEREIQKGPTGRAKAATTFS